MTERTMMVPLTLRQLNIIHEEIKDLSNVAMNQEEVDFLEAFEKAIDLEYDALKLMDQAKKVYEDDLVVLFEHPDDSTNEKSLMAYLKENQYFEEDTGEREFDGHTASLVVENMRAAFRSF